MDLRVFPTEDAVAVAGAEVIALALQAAVDARGIATLAVSGGSTPRPTLERLAEHNIDWDRVHLVQVDERVAAVFDGDRNLVMQRDALVGRVEMASVLPMPVTEANLARAAYDYNDELGELTGWPVELDVVQLGLGSDGHTASLVPSDPALDIDDRDVAVSQPYQGRQRMTLTVPAIRRARQVIWVVIGESKRDAVEGLLNRDPALPASLVASESDILVVDAAAAPGRP